MTHIMAIPNVLTPFFSVFVSHPSVIDLIHYIICFGIISVINTPHNDFLATASGGIKYIYIHI